MALAGAQQSAGRGGSCRPNSRRHWTLAAASTAARSLAEQPAAPGLRPPRRSWPAPPHWPPVTRRLPVATKTPISAFAASSAVGLRAARLAGAIHQDVDQAGLAEPGLDLAAVNPSHSSAISRAHPFVIVLVHVGDDQPAARLQHAHHLADGRRGVGAVMQVHVGKDCIHAGIVQRQGAAVGHR